MPATESNQHTIAVVGSLNVDYVAQVAQLPVPGETVVAAGLEIVHGGKGANQAIAAARQGCVVRLIGSVGDDEMGRTYLAHLAEEGIETSGVRQVAGASTGAAFISVEESGENTIVVAAGANGLTSADQIRARDPFIAEADALLAQFEVPLAAVVEALRIANRAGVLTVLNPSPNSPTFPWATVDIDYLVVNEIEADEILEAESVDARNAEKIRALLAGLRVRNLVVTRGSDSTQVITAEDAFEVPTMAVVPVDTVGAGDAFAGCFAARMAAGEALRDAVLAANCAGALTTLGSGAQRPIPDRVRVDQHRDRH